MQAKPLFGVDALGNSGYRIDKSSHKIDKSSHRTRAISSSNVLPTDQRSMAVTSAHNAAIT